MCKEFEKISRMGTIREHCQLIIFNYLGRADKNGLEENGGAILGKLLILNGGQRRDRTADAGLFRAGGIDRVPVQSVRQREHDAHELPRLPPLPLHSQKPA